MNSGATQSKGDENATVPFVLADYIQNPVRLARVENGLTRKQLAALLGISVGYLGKIERQDKTAPVFLERAIEAMRNKPSHL